MLGKVLKICGKAIEVGGKELEMLQVGQGELVDSILTGWACTN